MVQILPVDDDFAAGTPTYGANPNLYIGLVASTSTSTPWLPALAWVLRRSHSGYQSVNPITGRNDFNCAFTEGGNTQAPYGMIFRRLSAADCVVTGTFEMRLVSGSIAATDWAPRGVVARCVLGKSDGLTGDGTADVRYVDAKCYMAAVYRKSGDAAGTLRLGIFRVDNAGTAGAVSTYATLLESATFAPSLAGIVQPLTIKLDVRANGANVDLAASATGLGLAAPILLPTSGFTTDSSASKITAAGRSGFFMAGDHGTGKVIANLCHLFAVDEGATRKVQDEFRRLVVPAGKVSATDLAGKFGYQLSSAWTWDGATFDGSYTNAGKTYTGSKRFRRNATALRADFDHQVTDDDVNAGRLALSQRPADHLVSQHRSVKVIVPTVAAAATGEVWAGIALRAALTSPVAGQGAAVDENPPTVGLTGAGPNFVGCTGYLFVVRAISSSSVRWQLHRVVNNTHFPIANLTEFTIFPGYGVQFTIDLDVYPRNSADPLGPVEMICKVNGSLLAMALTASATSAGMLNPSAGKFIDNTASRIQQNAGEGLALANGFFRTGTASADIDPVFEAWTQGTLTNAVTLDQDQLSVALLGEGTASGSALDTLLLADWPMEQEYASHELSNPFDSGHRQTSPRFVKFADGTLIRRRLFQFRKRGVRRSELDALISSWNAHNGLELPVNYSPPGESAVKVHFVRDSLKYRLLARGDVEAYEVAFELEELL